MKDKKFALLVIDMQLVAFDGKITPPIPNASELLDTITALIDASRAANVPIIYLQTCAAAGRPYARDMHGWEIHPAVAPSEDDVVLFKVGPSGFENPQLHETLQQEGVTDVIVCGIWSEGCVAFTCDSALELGLAVSLPADAHSTVRETAAEALKIVTQQNERFADRNVDVAVTAELAARLT